VVALLMQVQMGTVQEMVVQEVQETISLKNHQKSHLIFLLLMTIKMLNTIDMNNNKNSKNSSGIIVQIK
jgi:hypothetical protein